MKYMGSKRVMLNNGLGEVLRAELGAHERVVDLFCGSGSVAWFAATQGEIPVVAVDLQSFATALAGSVIQRTTKLDGAVVAANWLKASEAWAQRRRCWRQALAVDSAGVNTATWCKRSRESLLDLSLGPEAVVTRCYGAHYFSLTQALLLDGMLQSLPVDVDHRRVCLAATIIAASECAASPGHTAQPFQATRTAAPFLREAWKRSPISHATRAVLQLAPLHAEVAGEIHTGDAVEFAATLRSTDVVFVDPPYSDVHYSRFYHVLETIARGRSGKVSGVGRYPPAVERPASAFSRRTESKSALEKLLANLGGTGCTVIFTFPADQSSNGLSGSQIRETAEKWFSVARQCVKSRFSTLGGNNENRDARTNSNELILVLKPRKPKSSVSAIGAKRRATRVR